jgi:hypothetical protein
MAGWEKINKGSDEMHRYSVPGGWLYADVTYYGSASAMVFVPEPRTAEYEEGYKDGFNDKAKQGEKVPAPDLVNLLNTAAQFVRASEYCDPSHPNVQELADRLFAAANELERSNG